MGMEQVVFAEVDVSDGFGVTPETAKHHFYYSFACSWYSIRKFTVVYSFNIIKTLARRVLDCT